MLWSDCADAQAGLGLRCPHMPEDTFSHGTVQPITSYPCLMKKKYFYLTRMHYSLYIPFLLDLLFNTLTWAGVI